MMFQNLRHQIRPMAWLTTALMVCGLVLAVGCTADDVATDPAAEGGLTVTPEFRVMGLDAAGDEVYLQDLFLGVGEIRLEPLGDADGVIYVTRAPLFLHFDLAAGEWDLQGTPLTLPHGGEYLISIRLEPLGSNVSEESCAHSVRMNGLLARQAASDGVVGVNSADEPMPVPWRLHGEGSDGPRMDKRVDWVAWTYATERPLAVLLNDVQFSDSEEEQSLVITFDLSGWLEEAFQPIQVAVEATEGEALEPTGDRGTRVEAVDVSEDLDDFGAGVEELSGFSEARVGERP